MAQVDDLRCGTGGQATLSIEEHRDVGEIAYRVANKQSTECPSIRKIA